MDIRIERSFTLIEDMETISQRLDKWSIKYGLTCTRGVLGNWEFRRGSQLVASFTFDVRKVPTTVSITIAEGKPLSVRCSIHVKSWLNIATPGDSKRVEEQMDLLISHIKGSI